MELRVSDELCYPLESACLLARLAAPPDASPKTCFVGLTAYKSHFSEEYRIPLPMLDTLFKPLQAVFDHVEKNLTIPRETLEDYFGQSCFPYNSYGTCVAYLNLTGYRLAEMEPAERLEIIQKTIFDVLLEGELRPENAPPPYRDESGLFDWISALEIPDAAKLYLLRFVHHAEELQTEITAILDHTTALLREQEKIFLPLVTAFHTDKQALFRLSGNDYFLEQYHLNIQSDVPEMIIAPSLAQFEAVGISELENRNGSTTLYYRIGCLVDPLIELSKSKRGDPESLVKRLRSLDDKRRLDILLELRRKPLCGQEIAELTGLSAGTVSHHMNALIQADFIDIRREGTRIQYTLSVRGVRAFLDELKEALLD